MKSVQPTISLALFGLAVGLAVKPIGDEPTPVPFYTVDLDQPEEKRWDHIIKEYAEDVKYVQKIMRFKGGSRFGRACTSIVSEDVNGQIWHARNMDYGFSDKVRNVTIGVHFQTGGLTMYSAITFVGYVGVLTGQKPHGYTITVDQRDQGNWWMNLLIGLLDHNALPVSLLVRDTLAYFKDFESAIENLAQTDTVAPAYFIIGGVHQHQGVVVTKSRIGADDFWYIGAEKNYSNWFLVETNYDHWEPAPTSDDRRHAAIKAMMVMGRQQISVQNLFNVISTPLVKNKKTIYSVVMSAAQPSLMKAWVRYPE
ncbi:N-acylethanolamine-hydrolyzing acid amidase-like [Gigantopelta aegis]|uniref:N-acylethanolamine-hydrolyzing acid amidase-like n=1 Tax=Gigantopelta aegis TaxID=1735272 RepID=UPI001B889E07|nr:N-acylethanolamine-hydrolyzing acid amidase-like [Gigantopelta aegis]